MDDENVQALAALQVSGSLSEHVHLRGVSTCPHCHQGFGSASLPIHVRRCRALLPQKEEEVAEEQKSMEPIKRKQVRSLVDLCLRFVTKHFESVCMDKIVAFPEAEAALIASMPSSLVHRMVINLVEDSKRIKAKNRELRATVDNLESVLQGVRRVVAQLESARDWAAISRARMAEQQQVAERLQRKVDATRTALAAAEAESQQHRTKAESTDKKLLRLEAKINMLSAEKLALKKSLMESQRREMEATRQLASAKKASTITNTSTSRRGFNRAREHTKLTPRQNVPGLTRPNLLQGTDTIPALRNKKDPVIYRNRPRSDGSKIPYPASVRMKYQA